MTTTEISLVKNAVKYAKTDSFSKTKIIDYIYNLFNFNGFKYTLGQIESVINIYW